MSIHESTFEFVQPSEDQKEKMNTVRAAANAYAQVLNDEIPEGPDKTYLLRTLRTVAMWANVAITRQPDGTPRTE